MTSSVPANWNSFILHGVNPTGKEMGRGAYGRVFEVDYEGTLCAAKEVHALLLRYAQDDELQKIKSDFLTECQIWSTLRHPCIVQFLGVYYPAIDQYGLPVMVMEKMQQSLRALVERYENIPLNVKLSILDEVCLGLRYLHSKNPPIVHRDLTPNNILLSRYLEAKITDLGVAKVMRTTDTKTMTKAPGTTDFMPPECLADTPVYGVPLDVFSYGGVILYTITQTWPQPSSLIQIDPDTGSGIPVDRSEAQRRQRYLDQITEEAADLKSLVVSCLDNNPNNRPQLVQISMTFNRLKELCSQRGSRDGISPIVWWTELHTEQQSQVTSSLTTALEEMRKENDVLKTDIMQLRISNDAMKDENKKLKSMIKAENVQLTTEDDDGLKASASLPITGTRHTLKKQALLEESTTTGDLFSRSVIIKWEKGAPAPVDRYAHMAVWLNGLVYVGAGNETQTKPSYTINCYDPINNSWLSPISTPYCYYAMTTLNNQLLVAGGQKKYKRTDEILLLDTTDSLRKRLRYYNKMTSPRSCATAAGHQGMLIITGGEDNNGKMLSSTEMFDSNNNQWYACSDLPQPHYQLQSVIVDNTLYLLGGLDKSIKTSQTVFTAPLDTLSSHQLKWNVHQNTPWFCSAPVSIHGTHLLVIGGYRSYRYTSDIYKFNKASHSWEVIGQIPSAKSSLAAVSTGDNRIIVIGGRNDKGVITDTVLIGSCEPQ